MTSTIVIAAFELGFGGATAAIVDQTRLFTDHGMRVVVATFAPSPAAMERGRALQAEGEIPPTVELRNVHDDFRRRNAAMAPLAVARRRARDLRRRWRARGQTVTTSTRDGVRVDEYCRGDRLAATVRYSRGGVPVERELPLPSGGVLVDHLWRGDTYMRQWFDADRRLTREKFLTPDAFAFLSRVVDPATGKSRELIRHDRFPRRSTAVKGLPAWHAAWLQSIVDACDGIPVVIGESQGVVSHVSKLRPGSAVRIGMFHATHLEPPYHHDSEVRRKHREAFAKSAGLERIVAVSEGQAASIAALVAHPEKVRTIPNPVVSEPVSGVARDPRLVTVVSRLHPLKAVPDAVAAFAQVVAAVPDARLEIHGRGPDRARVKAAIEKHGLRKSVLLRGRTSRPREVMAASVCTVSTSQSETMGLSIAESCLQETPVVAYDCLFGPAELIDNGVTGRLVPLGDVDALAAAIIAMLEDPEGARRMGVRAKKRLEDELSPERAWARWRVLIDEASREVAARA